MNSNPPLYHLPTSSLTKRKCLVAATTLCIYFDKRCHTFSSLLVRTSVFNNVRYTHFSLLLEVHN